MEVKFSKLSLPSRGVAVILITKENLNSENLAKFTRKSPVKFSADYGQIIPTSQPDEHDLDLVILVGLGQASKISENKMRNLGGKITSFFQQNKLEQASIIIDEIENTIVETGQIAAEIAYGMNLKNYRFDKYLSEEKKRKSSKITKLDFRLEQSDQAMKLYDEYSKIAENVYFARDLISEPANILTTEAYAKICKSLESLGLKVDVLGEKEMKKLGMHSLLAVGQASITESQLVILEWRGDADKDKAPLAFVGKGVVFDTGGISLKPSLNMDAMKADMGGSAAVVGLMRTLATRNAKVNAIGVIGLVENMPGGNAQRPGDIVTSMSGQTIECLNTDAEGRMVLADALYYAKTKYNPELIIDLATLTGAIVVTLADVYSGLFSNDDNLSEKLIAAGKATDEKLWRLPLGKEFDEMINTPNADMKNIGNGRGAGSITAAQFLQRFIGDTPWAHLDIAGTSMKDRPTDISAKGATAFGVRLLNKFVKTNYA